MKRLTNRLNYVIIYMNSEIRSIINYFCFD